MAASGCSTSCSGTVVAHSASRNGSMYAAANAATPACTSFRSHHRSRADQGTRQTGRRHFARVPVGAYGAGIATSFIETRNYNELAYLWSCNANGSRICSSSSSSSSSNSSSSSSGSSNSTRRGRKGARAACEATAAGEEEGRAEGLGDELGVVKGGVGRAGVPKGVPPEAGGKSLTQRIMEALPPEGGAGGAGGQSSFEALRRADESWQRVRSMKTGVAAGAAPEVVRRTSGKAPIARGELPAAADVAEYDVAVCGGTLGVFVATALALKGKKVAIIERGKLMGRSQEWNISRKELVELVELGVISEEEAERVIQIEFNPNRCGFAGGKDVWVRDILNLGVSPVQLIEIARQRFESLGGLVLDESALSSIEVFDDVALLSVTTKTAEKTKIAARLVVDAMGNFSPIVRQVRWGQRPDGICLVVGSCARGFAAEKNKTSDIIFTDRPLEMVGDSPCQFFWEAFPSGSGPTDRTTYLFTYIDADPSRPSLEQLLERYWGMMPQYQGVDLEDLEIRRVLFGFFPTYRDSPLPAAFDRIIQVGDASGIQSPLSFGGFGSITRHLRRISSGLSDALDLNLLSKDQLALINPYQPNLSGAWLLQRAMSAPVGTSPPPDFINKLLACNFGQMEKFGDPVLRPFLQDVTQFSPLALTMGSMMLAQPGLLPQILQQVGIVPLVDWLVHFVALGNYTLLSSTLAPLIREWANSLPAEERFVWNRRLEAWEFGAGLDYKL